MSLITTGSQRVALIIRVAEAQRNGSAQTSGDNPKLDPGIIGTTLSYYRICRSTFNGRRGGHVVVPLDSTQLPLS
jgi:hypothetical protein